MTREKFIAHINATFKLLQIVCDIAITKKFTEASHKI